MTPMVGHARQQQYNSQQHAVSIQCGAVITRLIFFKHFAIDTHCSPMMAYRVGLRTVCLRCGHFGRHFLFFAILWVVFGNWPIFNLSYHCSKGVYSRWSYSHDLSLSWCECRKSWGFVRIHADLVRLSPSELVNNGYRHDPAARVTRLLSGIGLRQNGRDFPDGIFKCIFFSEDAWISQKFVPKCQLTIFQHWFR